MFDKLKRFVGWVLLCSVGLSVFYLLSLPRHEIVRPIHPKDLKRVSAQVLSDNTAGSGVVLRSSSEGSEILTNAHVCDDSKRRGGEVVINGFPYEVIAIKPSHQVDLCLMRIKEDLYIGIVLASTPPVFGDPILAGGFPLAMPLLVQSGYVSEVFNISEDIFNPALMLLTSVMVQPGASGSGVFNERGELIAILEAFKYKTNTDNIGFGLAVPYQHVKQFVNIESKKLSWTEVPHGS